MPTPSYTNYISQVTLPGTTPGSTGTTYHIKDSEARQWIEQIIAGGISFIMAWDGHSVPVPANIPAGVSVTYEGTTYVGTKVASAETQSKVYLVAYTIKSGRTVYAEYATIIIGGAGTVESPYQYAWERLGDTDIKFDDLGALAWKNDVTLNKGTGDEVLGTGTTFSTSNSAVSFSGGATETFLKSYTGSTSKMATTSITGVNGEVSFNAVKSNNPVTATKVTFGTNAQASAVTVTSAGTANKTTLGTPLTASKAKAETSATVATAAASNTSLSYIGNASTSSVLEAATVEGETLIFGSVGVTQSSVKGVSGTQTIPQYSFTDVSVPTVSVGADVSVQAVSAANVTVPVITAHEDVSATNVEIESKTAATKAATATQVATGALDTEGAGASVMVGLGEASTGTAVTNIGTGVAAAQTITVGTNDKVNVAKYSDLSVTVS